MALQTLNLWSRVRSRPQIDPNDLAEAVAHQAAEDGLDYRTRLLIRDSVDALTGFWGQQRVDRWLAECPMLDKIMAIRHDEYERVGFPSIKKRLMEKTTSDTIRQLLEYLGQRLHRPLRIYVAGSAALILPGNLSRHTDDIDIVDEVPEDIRNNHRLLEDIQMIYSLSLGHVQSHYFPVGWRDRAHSLAPFGKLQIFLLDIYDVHLRKLFSFRVKDTQDMRVLTPQINKQILAEKLKAHAKGFLAAPRPLEIAQNSWKVIYGEDLPQ